MDAPDGGHYYLHAVIDDGLATDRDCTAETLYVSPWRRESHLDTSTAIVYSAGHSVTDAGVRQILAEGIADLAKESLGTALEFFLGGGVSGVGLAVAALKILYELYWALYDPVRILPVGYGMNPIDDEFVAALTSGEDEFSAIVFLDFIDAEWSQNPLYDPSHDFYFDLKLTASDEPWLWPPCVYEEVMALLPVETLRGLDETRSYMIIPTTMFDASDVCWWGDPMQEHFPDTRVTLEARIQHVGRDWQAEDELDLLGDRDRGQELTDPFETLADWTVSGSVARVDDGSGTNSVAQLTEASDAGIFQTVYLPPGASDLLFKYHFPSKGDGDSLEVRLGDEVIWSLVGTDYQGASLQESLPIDVREAGGDGAALEFWLKSVGDPNCQVWVDDLTVVMGDLPAPPTIVELSIEAGDIVPPTSREFSVEFAMDVQIEPDALAMVGQSAGAVDLSSAEFAYDAGTRSARWTLVEGLPPDEYVGTIVASKVTDTTYLLLDGNGDGMGGDDREVRFWVTYPGDANTDGIVGIADLTALADNYGRTQNVAWWNGDFNEDGIIGIADLSTLADNYGRELDLPPEVLGGPVEWNGHTYYLLTQSGWTNAEAKGVELGGHLVTINSAEEHAWVYEQFSLNGTRHLWLGLNDVAEEGQFVWASGETAAYGNWSPNQPDNNFQGAPESYVHMKRHEEGAWNDFVDLAEWPDGTALHGVVEVPGLDPLPSPALSVL